MVVRCRLKIPSRRITRLAEWCRTVIPNDGIFNSHQTVIMDSFSCMLFLHQQYLSVNMCYFVNLALNYLHFWSREVWLGCDIDVVTFGGKWHKKPTSWHKNWCCDAKKTFWRHARESSFTPGVKQPFLAPVGFTEFPVRFGYARKISQNWPRWGSKPGHPCGSLTL